MYNQINMRQSQCWYNLHRTYPCTLYFQYHAKMLSEEFENFQDQPEIKNVEKIRLFLLIHIETKLTSSIIKINYYYNWQNQSTCGLILLGNSHCYDCNFLLRWNLKRHRYLFYPKEVDPANKTINKMRPTAELINMLINSGT